MAGDGGPARTLRGRLRKPRAQRQQGELCGITLPGVGYVDLGIAAPLLWEGLLVALAECVRIADGMDGIVCSPLDLATVKAAGGGLFTVVPGVRPAASPDDQARRATPLETVKNGADYLVVGRPRLNAPDRIAAVRQIEREIEEGLAWIGRK